MSKRILVIEDPECCAGCPFLVDSVCDHCRVADDRPIDDIGEIPDWCPLVPAIGYIEAKGNMVSWEDDDANRAD